MAAGTLRAGRGGTRDGETTASWASADAWPRTLRAQPWLIAVFLVMLVLLPFDSIELPVATPVDATADRVAVVGLLLAFLLIIGSGAEVGRLWKPVGIIGVAGGLFLVAAAVSVLVNFHDLEILGEAGQSVKRGVLLFSYVVVFLLVVCMVQARDIPGLGRLLVVLGCICAVGVIYQYRAGQNLFFQWTRDVVGGVIQLTPEPVKRNSYDRAVITGPTRHGLAATAMLMMIAPLALSYALDAKKRARQILYGLAFALLVFAALSTLRRSAVLAPLAVILVFLIRRPRQTWRLAPLAIPAYAIGAVLTPGVAGNLRGQFSGTNSSTTASTRGRTEDYLAITTDVLHAPIFGMGYGTYQPMQFRVLDNQYLGYLVTTGVFGVVAYAFLLFAVGWTAWRLDRIAPARYRPFAIAALAATAVTVVLSALFDFAAFPQGYYLFFILAAFVLVIMADVRRPAKDTP